MYRGTPSPIFDVPEFPTLRRVKPLPKRRRTSAGTGNENMPPTSVSALAAQGATALLQQGAAAAFLQQQQHQQPLDVLGPNATAEELLAHADTLSARMALQSYYMPILGGVQNFLAGAAAATVAATGLVAMATVTAAITTIIPPRRRRRLQRPSLLSLGQEGMDNCRFR
ncbi:hypothetical protein BDZ97DRAFT_1200995 [Flammula alnicola]|nr:hypothetical protein BDZ97DRAFT_1200995 [Flammula alnicola]